MTEKYEKILTDLNFIFDKLNAENINDDKFEVLIRTHILEMNPDMLKFVREKYPKHIYKFIKCNLDKYL